VNTYNLIGKIDSTQFITVFLYEMYQASNIHKFPYCRHNFYIRQYSKDIEHNV